jgi:hypothetical protein
MKIKTITDKYNARKKSKDRQEARNKSIAAVNSKIKNIHLYDKTK